MHLLHVVLQRRAVIALLILSLRLPRYHKIRRVSKYEEKTRTRLVKRLTARSAFRFRSLCVQLHSFLFISISACVCKRCNTRLLLLPVCVCVCVCVRVCEALRHRLHLSAQLLHLPFQARNARILVLELRHETCHAVFLDPQRCVSTCTFVPLKQEK